MDEEQNILRNLVSPLELVNEKFPDYKSLEKCGPILKALHRKKELLVSMNVFTLELRIVIC